MQPDNTANSAGDSLMHEQPTLRARSWPAFAMMAHGLIDETLRIMHEGGLMQPGMPERVQRLRNSVQAPPQA